MRGDASVPSDESGWHLRSEAAYLRDFFAASLGLLFQTI